eukprot:5280784-Prymnesium_polylepis.1
MAGRPTIAPVGGPTVDLKLIYAGNGDQWPEKNQIVAIHYDAYLSNGVMWDSSRQRGKPLRFRLGTGQVIPGIDAGVKQMCLNQRVRLHIPPSLAYGEKGFPGRVPPHTGIEFDLELVEIV